jgi:hypothetical protein
MNAIKQVRKYLELHPKSEASAVLARLVAALGEESEVSLQELYALEREPFELAIELLKDWRLDRYYAARIKLFDYVLAALPEQARGPSGGASSDGRGQRRRSD